MVSLIKDIILNIGILSIYDNNACVIRVSNVDYISDNDVLSVVTNCEESVQGNYGLISDRTHSYSTNPLELFKILSHSNRLKCAAVVSHRDSTKRLYPVENTIKNEATHGGLPMEMFENLDSALDWVSNIL